MTVKTSCLPWWLPKWLARFSQHPSFRVLYKDGQWSRPMRYSSAEDLADIFGGEVRWADEFDESLQFSRQSNHGDGK